MTMILINLFTFEKQKTNVTEILFSTFFILVNFLLFGGNKPFFTIFSFLNRLFYAMFRAEVTVQVVLIPKLHITINTSILLVLFNTMELWHVSVNVLFILKKKRPWFKCLNARGEHSELSVKTEMEIQIKIVN